MSDARRLSRNPLFGVPALAGPGRLKAGHQTCGTPDSGSCSQCIRKSERASSSFSSWSSIRRLGLDVEDNGEPVHGPNHPGTRLAACRRKAALETHALRTLRDCLVSLDCAKRLECVRCIGAFRTARDSQRFMVLPVVRPMPAEPSAIEPFRISMLRPCRKSLTVRFPLPQPPASRGLRRRGSASSTTRLKSS